MAELIQEIPEVGTRFRNPDEAWQYWVAYGGRMGFDVRKRYTNVSSYDRKVTSCRYVCSNEGHRKKGLTTNVTKCFRAETRTDCKVKLHKVRRKTAKSSVPSKKGAKQKKNGATKPQVEVEHDGKNKEGELQEYTVIGNFTQLITAPTLENLELPDLF